MKIKFLIIGLLALGGCQSGMISADAIDGTLRRVADRDDKYTAADATLSPAQKIIDLRDTELLRKVLDNAKPSTQPAK